MTRLRLNIGSRLILSFVIIILCMLISDAFVLLQFRTVQRQAQQLNAYDEELTAVVRVHTDLLRFRDTLETAANERNVHRLKYQVEEMNQEFADDTVRAVNALQIAHLRSVADPTLIPTLAVVQSALHSQTASMIGLAEGGDWNALQLRVENQLRPLQFSTSALVETVDREVKSEQAEVSAEIRHVQQRIFLTVPIAIILTLLIAGTLGVMITRSITRPLESLVAGSKMLAAGDFQYRVRIQSDDELAHLGRVFNDTANQLRNLYQTLQHSEDRLRRVIDTIPAHVWSTLPDGSVDFINQRLLESTGLPVDRLLGSGWQSIVHPDDRDRYLGKWKLATTSGDAMETEARIWTSLNEYRWLLVRNVPLRDGDGRILKWYGTGIDIEERKRTEDALRKAHADLAHANRVTTMGELSASLAHEINQPISGAVTNASTCLRWLNRDEPDMDEARAAATRILRDANRAAEIINRVRLLFRKGILNKEPVNINEVVREMNALLLNEAALHSVSILTNIEVNLPTVLADRVQLQQVMMNLMVNAIDAMKMADNPRQLTLISRRNSNREIQVSVQDTGIGLPREQAGQMFDAFFTTKENGTGMGLRISRTIIEAHGGRLWATDNTPRGAAFHFTLLPVHP